MNTRGILSQKQVLSRMFASVTLFGVFLLLMGSFTIVDSGHVGVVRFLGAVQPVALSEGFHLKKPFLDKIEKVDVRLARFEAKAASSSRDLQTVQTQVTIQFSLQGEQAPVAYQKIGRRQAIASTLLGPAIQESVKAITAKYTAEQLITQRAIVKVQIQEAIDRFIEVTLAEKGAPGSITIANVAITDFDFSNEFNRAIELKVKAEQEALQAKNEKIRRITQAEAAAAEKKLGAQADAYQIEVASKARAEAIAREAKALKDNPQLIQLRTVERWNGKLPAVNGSSAIPLLDLRGVVNK